MSIGSLDGFLYSFSPNGDLKKFLETTASNSVIQVSPVADCSGFAVYISQIVMEGKSSRTTGNYTYISAMKPINIVFSLLAPATGTFYWTGKYPGKCQLFISFIILIYSIFTWFQCMKYIRSNEHCLFLNCVCIYQGNCHPCCPRAICATSC